MSEQDLQKTLQQKSLFKAPGTPMYKWTLGILILFVLYLAYRVFSPFLTPIIFSSVLAAICFPLYSRLCERFGGRRNLAALAVLVLVVVCVFIPIFFFLTGMVAQGATSIAELNAWLKSADAETLLAQLQLQPMVDWVQLKLPFLDLGGVDFQSGIMQFSRNVGQTMISLGTHVLGNAVGVLIDFIIMLFILFFLLRDGHAVIARIKYLSPLREEQEDTIISSLRNVSRSVLVGGLLVAVLQGLAGGIGLALVGIPALFWGAMMGFASLVPVLGTGLVWVPAATYLLLVAKWKSALFLLVWCGAGVTSIDTFLRPYFMRGSSGMPLLYIFLSVIGGLQVFGPAGLLYGPLILSSAMVMLRLYGEEFSDELTSAGPKPAGGDEPAP